MFRQHLAAAGSVAARAARPFASVPAASADTGLAPRIALPARFRSLPPPVLVIGMHRSGTSLVAGMLARLGVTMGPDLELPCPASAGTERFGELCRAGYGEALELRRLNERLLHLSGADWDRPLPFLESTRAHEFSTAAALRLRRALASPDVRCYARLLRAAQNRPWGWKDPRTTLTLPCWRQLFPEARIVHVRRDPEAAALSLWRRESALASTPRPRLTAAQRLAWWAAHPRAAVRRLGRAVAIMPRREGARPAAAHPCRDLDYCRGLADLYTRQSLRARESGAEFLEVWYEDVLADPVREAARLARFSGCRAEPTSWLSAALLACPPDRPMVGS